MLYRGTTPTINLLFKDKNNVAIDLSQHSVYVTIESNIKEVTFQNDRITFNANYSMDITLTQQETLDFYGGNIKVQLRAIKNNKAIASDIVTTTIGEILKDGIIE